MLHVDRLSDPYGTDGSHAPDVPKGITDGRANPSPSTPEELLDRAVESAVVRAIFGGNDRARRHFLKLVGAGTAAAVVRSLFPLDTAKAMAQDKVKGIEKKDLAIGFIPITCATPIIMAEPMGFYAKHGLDAKVRRASGWAMVRDWAINKEVDAAHMLSPMPLSITLGAGSQPVPYYMPAVENINGQAITLHKRYREYLQVAGLLQLTWLRRLVTVVLPAAAPAIIAGLRISFGSALVTVVPAEMLLGELGVGYLTWIEWNNLDVAGVIFAILVVGAVGVLMDMGFNRLARLVTYTE